MANKRNHVHTNYLLFIFLLKITLQTRRLVFTVQKTILQFLFRKQSAEGVETTLKNPNS